MGKLTLAILVLAIALGVYWFWWSDQGANSPITVEGTMTVSGMPRLPGAATASGPQEIDFTIQTVPGKIRLSATIEGQTFANIIRLDKRESYTLDMKGKKYALEEFDLVDMGQTELHEKGEDNWPQELTRTADWEYISTDENKWFCNRQTMTGLPKELTDAANLSAAGGPAAALFATMFENVKLELWFTPKSRVGRRHFRTVNKLIRIRQVGSGIKEEGKRPQFEYLDLAFFPFPLKANISLGQMKIEMDVKRFSRNKIPKDVFEIPSGFAKVNKQEITPPLGPST